MTDLISVQLKDVYSLEWEVNYAPRILFDLLLERDPNINVSHKKMPTWLDHCNFFASKPYRKWYLIEGVSWDTEKHVELEPGSAGYATAIVGACYLTRMNEIGVFLFKQYRGKGFGTKAVYLLTTKHKPLKAISGKRSGRYLAHINPANEKSIALFSKIGFTHLSDTYVL